MGASFDDALIEAVATVVSTEGRAFNNANRSGLDFWTPNINPFKDPRWGRGQETPGEDPFHLQSYVNNLITGLQGGRDPPTKKVVATCKHFAAYDLESWNGNFRYQFDAQVNSQDLVEYYLPPFQQCARDSNVGAVMCSYNSVNGVPACADPYLLQDILRDHWGWTNEDQWVTSDCDAVENIYIPHNYTSSPEETVAVALNAGTDVNCGTYYPMHLPAALEQGLTTEAAVNQALIRQYSSLVKLGYFDPPNSTYRSLAFSDVSTPASEQLTYKAAVEGITLLKNDGTLPLNLGSISSMAIIGDWANATTQMQGNYEGVARYLHSPLYAAQQLGNITINYGNGPGQGNPTTDGWGAPLSAANNSDVVVYIGGIDNDVEAEGMDRYNIDWLGFQIDIIQQVCAMGKPCILVQMGGGQLDDTPFKNNPNVSAIMWAGYPGQSGGDAIINTLVGREAPAGRLPVTQYPAGYVNQVPMTDMTLRPSTNNPGRTYMFYTGTPIYEFGSGQHYTNFSLSLPRNATNTFSIDTLTSSCNATFKDTCSFATLPISVANTGAITSDFVTLGFLSSASVFDFNKRLVAYERLHNVTAGSTQTAQLNMTLGSLARIEDNGDKTLNPGDYAVLVDVPTQATWNFTLTGSAVTLESWPQPSLAQNSSTIRRSHVL
ncbi:MAG: hypothetical protein Q9160_007578 [Pyrenula sp. 1 TL-2023]